MGQVSQASNQRKAVSSGQPDAHALEQFNSKAVLRQTGLSPEVLRAWERRYGAVRPGRSASGRRLYTSEEVHRLRMLAELVRRGLTIGRIARESDQTLVELLAQTDGGAGVQPSSRKKRETDTIGLIQTLRTFDLQRMKHQLSRMRFSVSPREFALDWIPHLMFQVGVGVSEGSLSIAQEHAMSDLVMRELRTIYASLEVLDGTARPEVQMIFATREGDYHEFGLLMAAVVARYRGIRCQYLGVNLPAESLNQSLDSLRPDAVVLGLAHLPVGEEKVTAQDFLRGVTRARALGIEIWAGGSAAGQLDRRAVRQDLLLFESVADFERQLELRFPLGSVGSVGSY
jgi:DNA-binding transcriptional MerR regulator